MKALIKIQYVRRPISQALIGCRLSATVPNLAARKMKARMADDGTVDAFYATAKMVPSFRKPYLILESSDYNAIDRQEIERFLAKLVWQGFDEWEFIGNWQTVSIA